ncbi:MAG: FtsX-like permease family protein [Actinobacteria bacterium]|nr:FtsX-like permease family protein [Actinomycetota bacterium]
MSRSVARLLAVRGLRRRPLRSVLTTAGIILGVGMVVGVLSLSATLLKGFEQLFDVAYGKTDLVISKPNDGPPGPFRETVLAKVRAVEGVDRARTVGIASGDAFLVDAAGKVADGASNQLSLTGAPIGEPVADYSIASGRDLTAPDDFLVEEGWAKDKRVRVGDVLRVALPTGVRGARVTGVFAFAKAVSFGGVGFALEPLAAAQRDLTSPGQINQIYVRASDRSKVAQLRTRLRATLGPGLAVETPSGEVDRLSNQLKGFNVFLLFFAGVALFVGAFLIFNAFNISVLQRTRELGMLRTIGVTKWATIRIVLAEALVLGVVGSVLGVLVGVGLAKLLILLMSSVFVGIPFGSLTVPVSAVVSGLVVGVLVTLLAAFWPARRAGKTSPLQAMRTRTERVGVLPWKSAIVGVVLILASIPGIKLIAGGDTSGGAAIYGQFAVAGIFYGLVLATPLVIRPLVRLLAVPLRPFSPVNTRLASDNASRASARTALTAGSVMVGLALAVMFAALSASIVQSIRDGIDNSLQSDFVVVPRAQQLQGFSPTLATDAAKLPSVAAVSPSRFGSAKVNGKDKIVIAVSAAGYPRVVTTRLVGGGTPDWAALDRDGVMIDPGYAKDPGAKVGDTLTFATPSGPERVRVAGIVDDKVEGPPGKIFVSLVRGERVAGLTKDNAVYIAARDSEAARASLKNELQPLVDRYPVAKLYSNNQLKDQIERSFNQFFGFLYALLGVAVIASLFGIVNTLAMSVLERTREIGMMRAIGATRGQIRQLIRRESILVTLVGAVLGLLVGLVLGWVFVRATAQSFPGLAFAVPWNAVVAIAIGAVVMGVIAAALPARRAARLNVIDALTYE